MLNLFYRALNNKKGFTLIEVLVVVVIIGILAALAAPRIIGRIQEARVSSDQAMARALNSAVEQWIFDGGDAGDDAIPTWDNLKPYLDDNTWALVEASTTETERAAQIEDEAIIAGEADGVIAERKEVQTFETIVFRYND